MIPNDTDYQQPPELIGQGLDRRRERIKPVFEGSKDGGFVRLGEFFVDDPRKDVATEE